MILDNVITVLLLGKVHEKQLLLESFKPVVPKLFLNKIHNEPHAIF